MKATAAGFPEKGRSVKESTTDISSAIQILPSEVGLQAIERSILDIVHGPAPSRRTGAPCMHLSEIEPHRVSWRLHQRVSIKSGAVQELGWLRAGRSKEYP